jgi:chemotaxis family two-component system response regulator Rcp1
MTLLKDVRPIEILLVEDNPGDVRLTIEALKEVGVSNRLSVAPDGVEAVKLLKREVPHGGAPRPDVIILDLNLPKKNGLDLLRFVKGDASLRRIPVIVLTTSDADDDVLTSYDLYANCYVKKPIDMEQFIQVVRAIDAFWFGVVTLPSERG